MRQGWERSAPEPDLDIAALAALIHPAFPKARVSAAERTVGGFANANYRLEITGRERPVLLRLFVRDPASAAKEAAIAEHIAGRVPVAPLIHFAASIPDGAGNRLTACWYWAMCSRRRRKWRSATSVWRGR